MWGDQFCINQKAFSLLASFIVPEGGIFLGGKSQQFYSTVNSGSYDNDQCAKIMAQGCSSATDVTVVITFLIGVKAQSIGGNRPGSVNLAKH